MSSCISAIGTANPKYQIKQDDIYHFMVNAFALNDANAGRLAQIYKQSGIKTRFSAIPDFQYKTAGKYEFFPNTDDLEPFPGTKKRIALYQQAAIETALKAAQNCLEKAGTDVHKSITHLITVSCTGMYAPGIDVDLVERLNLSRKTERTCINFMGCYGAINALKIADYISRADDKAKILIVSIELCTLHFQKENTLDNWVANTIFSDGAAAVLVEKYTQKQPSKPVFLLRDFYAEFIFEANHEMGWYMGDIGFEMKLTSKVPKLIKKHISEITTQLLAKTKLAFNEITDFAVHPGGRKILEAAEFALNIPAEANKYAYETLQEFGNMSSATILFVLEKMLKNSPQKQGKHVMSFAFGPGLTVESMILTYA